MDDNRCPHCGRKLKFLEAKHTMAGSDMWMCKGHDCGYRCHGKEFPPLKPSSTEIQLEKERDDYRSKYENMLAVATSLEEDLEADRQAHIGNERIYIDAEVVRDLCDDLEAELNVRHAGNHPVTLRALQRDMNTIDLVRGSYLKGKIPEVKTSDRITIEVYQQDWMPGFAAFHSDGSIHKDAVAHVSLNVGSLLAAVANEDIDSADLPYIIVESLLHEFTHAMEAWAKVEFSEEKVHEITDKYIQALKAEGGEIDV